MQSVALSLALMVLARAHASSSKADKDADSTTRRRPALPVLRHRLSPNYNAMGEGLDASDIVRELLERVPVPTPAGR